MEVMHTILDLTCHNHSKYYPMVKSIEELVANESEIVGTKYPFARYTGSHPPGTRPHRADFYVYATKKLYL